MGFFSGLSAIDAVQKIACGGNEWEYRDILRGIRAKRKQKQESLKKQAMEAAADRERVEEIADLAVDLIEKAEGAIAQMDDAITLVE